MKRTVRIGIIGTGIGVRTMIPAFRAIDGAEVVAVTGSNRGRTRDIAFREGISRPMTDYRQLCELDELDLICIASPNVNHYEHATYALRTGKSLLVEKPLALTMVETQDLCSLQRQGSRLFAIVDHQLRFNPSFRKVRDLLRSGSIGHPYLVRLHQQSFVHPGRDAPWGWSFDARSGGGTRLAIGSHLLDLLWFWFGHRAVHGVAGALEVLRSHRPDAHGINRAVTASDFFGAQLSLGGGLVAHLSASNAAYAGTRFDVEVHGAEGELRFDLGSGLRGSALTGMPAAGRTIVGPVKATDDRTAIFSPSFMYLAKAMVESLQQGDATPLSDATTFEEALPTQRVLDAIVRSSDDLELVRLDDGYRPGAMG